MSTQPIATQTMKISEVKSRLSSLVNEIYRTRTRVIVEKSGIPVAALVSIEELARLDRLQQEWDERFAVIDQMREAFKDISPDEIERDVTAIVREIRREEEREIRAREETDVERQPA